MTELGGTIVKRDGDLLHVTFTSKLFRFVDDVMLLIDGDIMQVRSSSRVGHSDFGANRERIERLRKLLS